MEWLYPPPGFVAGAVVGLTGMGGGSLMTPLLILLFGVPPLTAVGTDLLYAAVTKTAGTAIHSSRGNVDWSVAALQAAGSIPATMLTIWVLSLMPKEDPGTADVISISTGGHSSSRLPRSSFAAIYGAPPWLAQTIRPEPATRGRSRLHSVL
jgi:hypothetical protein